MRNLLLGTILISVGCAGFQIKLPPPPSKPKAPVEPAKPEFLPPSVSFSKATVSEIGFVSATVDFAFDVKNPNAVEVPLAELAYTFMVDGKEILKGDEAEVTVLAPNASTPVTLPVTLNFVDLGSTLAKLFSERESVPYALNLTTRVAGPEGLQAAEAKGAGLLALPRLPKVSGADATLTQLDLFGASLGFKLRVENPNPFPIQLGGMRYGLSVNDKVVLGGNEQGQELAPNASSVLALPLRLSFLDAAGSVVELLSENERLAYSLHADFGFPTSAEAITLPVDIAGDLALPKLPEIALAGVSLLKSSLTGATLRFDLRITNRSGFPIELKGLRYALALSEQPISQGQATPQKLAAKGESIVPVVVRLSYLDLGASVVKMIKKRKAPYRIRGALDFGLFEQSFDLSGQASF